MASQANRGLGSSAIDISYRQPTTRQNVVAISAPCGHPRSHSPIESPAQRGIRPMRAVDIIRKKRDGHALDAAEIDAFVAGATNGAWPDYQVSALLMAVVLRGMSPDETAYLTGAMVRSGERLDLSGLSGPKVDKHSTGG